MQKAVIFSAPSGSGKTTIVHRLIDRGLPLGFSISATSRAPRANEENGKDYFFLSPGKFKNKADAGEFLEWEEVYENIFYGTLKSECERIWNRGKAVVFDVDVKGGVRLKEILGNNALSIFVKTPSLEVLEQRLRARKTETEEAIEKRLKRAEYELGFEKHFDIAIINNKLDEAVDEVWKEVSTFLSY